MLCSTSGLRSGIICHGVCNRVLRAHMGDERATRLGGRLPRLRGDRDRRTEPLDRAHHRRDGHGLVGTWASVVGNEVSIRLGRQRLVRLAMTSCVACGAVIGFLGARSYPLAVGLVLVYACSSGWTLPRLPRVQRGAPTHAAGRHARAPFDGRYAGGFVGPLMIGWILDRAGGMSAFGWASPSCMSPSSP